MRQYLIKMILALALVGVFYGTGFAAMEIQETGHYPLGSEGIDAATIPPPGFYYRMYNAYYYADEDMDGGGNRVPINFHVSAFANVHRLVWVTNTKLFGADYFCDGLVPLVYTSVRADGAADHDFGVGDIFVEPFGLSWHQQRWDASFGLGVFAPTGQFSPERLANPGKDFWTQMTTLGFTYYMDEAKTWSASILSRYEVNTEQDDTKITPGNDFLFEWGIAKAITPAWKIGIAGYSQWQITDDTGSGVAPGQRLHDRVHAIGPEIVYGDKDAGCFISLRLLKEFGAVDRTQGTEAVLTLTKCF